MVSRPLLMPVEDLAPAAWVVEALTGFGGRVGDVVPPVFAAYARILHRPDQGLPDAGAASWAEVAAASGTVVHGEVQWHAIAGECDDQPLLGSLDRVTLPLLRDVLARHTTTPDSLWLGVWEGHGGQPAAWSTRPRFRIPGRSLHLFEGSVAGLTETCIELECAGMAFPSRSRAWVVPGGREVTDADLPALADQWRASGAMRSPNLWWPEDRAWAVASEIDFDSTVVGGSRELVQELLATPGLEVHGVHRASDLSAAGDTVNGT